VSYIESGYEIIDDPRGLERGLLDDCRGTVE